MCALYRYIHNEFDRERLFPPRLLCPHTQPPTARAPVASGPVVFMFITHFFSLVATKLESLVEPSDASCDISL